MDNFGLFVGNIASHWVYLMGGIAGIVIGTVETVRKKPWKGAFWFAAIMCLLASAERAWQDEHRNTELVKAEKSTIASAANGCEQKARYQEAFTRGLETQANSNRQTIDRQQAINDRQATDISGCLVSMGKLNPKIRRKIDVVPIFITTVDSANKSMSPSLGKTFFFGRSAYILLITTNETETNFHGYLKCPNNYNIVGNPQLPKSPQTIFTSSIAPKRISDTEYEISVLTSGGLEWSPQQPAYVLVSTNSSSIDGCTFSPIG